MNINQLMFEARRQLEQSPSPDADVRELLCYVLQCESTYLFTAADQELTASQLERFGELLKRRQQGEPIAYIVGTRGFWGVDLEVNSSTLIPRSDTELLVELALTKITANALVVDAGTGTGAIALALASERSDINVIASDFSFAATQLAQRNARRHQLEHVQCVNASWLSIYPADSIDMIVSNPPYIPASDPHLKQGDVRYEPLTALASGQDGLADLREIVSQALVCLKPEGWLIVEHGFDQSESVQRLFLQAGLTDISAHRDLGGNHRVVMGQYSPNA